MASIPILIDFNQINLIAKLIRLILELPIISVFNLYIWLFLVMKYPFKLYLVLFLLAISVTSCVECCNGDDFKFRARIEVSLAKSQSLELVYKTKNNKQEKVQGVLDNGFIEFCLNEEPLDLKFVLNEAKPNQELTISSLLLENNNNQMFINADMFYLYFIHNQAFIFNESAKKYKTVPNNLNTLKPTLNSRNSLNNRLKNRLR
ncbi:hypothetical protein ACW5R3_01800 [Bizionia sp. KMM 8389]